MGKWAIFATAGLLLAGCATSPGSYARSDGRATDAVQLRSILAQCQGEGASATMQYGMTGGLGYFESMASRSAKEAVIVNACMARNGYIAP